MSGKLYSWGKISDGWLGYLVEDKSDLQIEPKVIQDLAEYDIWYSACGIKRSMALTTCGKWFSWGKDNTDNKSGRSDFYKPRNLFEDKHFKNYDGSFAQISCGPTHCAALTSRGKLFMWGDLSEACQARSIADSSTRKFTYIPSQVDYFPHNGLAVYKVSWGNCFTAVATMKSNEFYFATRYIKSTSNDHISEALKIKLKKRMELKRRKNDWLSQKKLLSKSTKSAIQLNSLANLNLMDNNASSKRISDANYRSSSRLPGVGSPSHAMDLEIEYGK